ncbi:MAG: cation:proton antiporter [Nitrososphaerota archaeon]|nr:cation:proton antiporter [Nitrososphaerota archaeon]MDG7026234.1 cation:proton antiporter [Nitrososphaerota archaeon]
MADAILVFAVVAAIVFLGFLGELLFRRTGVPSFLFLILMGIVLGPGFHVFSGTEISPVLGLFAELTLIMILFYSGLQLRLSRLTQGGRAVALVAMYFSLSMIGITVFGRYVMHWNLLESMIFGSIIAGQTSTPVVVPLARSLKFSADTVSLVTIESVLNSIVGIITFLALVQIYSSPVVSLALSLTKVAATFSIGIVPAVAFSFVWLFILERVQEQRYTYVLLLGMVLVTYAGTEALGGSGELAVFIFGLIFGNYKVLNLLRTKQVDIDPLMSRVSGIQEEIAFLLNTLFFVFLGLTFDLGLRSVFMGVTVGLLLTAGLLGARSVSVVAATAGAGPSKNRGELILLSAQGVTQATLAILALSYALPLATTFLGLVSYVIIFTNLVTTIGAAWFRHRASFGFRDFMASLQAETPGVTG